MDRITERRPYNAVSDFVDSHIAAGRGNKAAFVDPERSLTYGELQARSIRFANALRDLGIGPEQRVALLLNDTVDYPVAFWGAIRAGCVAIPLNIYLTLPQYAYILADCRAQAIVADAALADAIRPVLETLPRKPALILVGGTTFPRAHAFETLIAKADTKPFTADTCRTRSPSGSTPRARPATPRASSTSTPT